MVINIMVSNHTPDELFSLPSIKSNLAGLLVYSERHMQRFAAIFLRACRITLNRAHLFFTYVG